MGNKNANNIKAIWFDEHINNKENQEFFKLLSSNFNESKGYESLNEGFELLYKNINKDFEIILVIVSGRLFGRYVKKVKENINKIINIPYTFIFTSVNFKKVLLGLIPDKEQQISYDTMMSVNSGFYNPGGVFDDFDMLLNEMKNVHNRIASNFEIIPRIKDKINYEGLLTFEYLNSEEELLAPALYRDIICNEKISRDECKDFNKYILSFNEGELNSLIKNLYLFKYLPFEILSKYWARCYTIESDFYKILNNDLMKSKLSSNYKTFIKVLYKGIDINSLKSYQGKYLYRGSVLNKIEVEKIKKYRDIGKLSKIVVFSKAFLSFSEDKEKAEGFSGESDDTKIGCLYILENNNVNLHESNADIQNFSVFPNEKEILFFPGSSFIIKNIKSIQFNKIEIILNYNGKFKENYSSIYENQEKLKNLLTKNIFTNELSFENLFFLKNGKYLMGEMIGAGSFGKVFKGKDLEEGEIVAIKQISKSEITHDELDLVYREVNCMKKISEKIKNSCKFKDFFETEDYFYIISSYYDDDLDHFLRRRKKLSPILINKVLKQLNEVFKELLKNHIVHRDIKPSNILIKYNNEEYDEKNNDNKINFDSFLADYGISKEISDEDDSMESMIGTPLFMAPEIFKGNGYKNNCDLYSIGVSIFLLYFGKLPFKEYITIDLLIKKKVFVPKIEEDKDLDDLVRKLLKDNPKERITWKEYFEHPFFKKYEY